MATLRVVVPEWKRLWEEVRGGSLITRLVVVSAAGFFLCGFAPTGEYEQRARDEVAFCVGFAKRDFPSFEAAVRSIDPATGEVAIERLNPDARGGPTFDRCLMAIRKWRWWNDISPGP